MFSRNSIKMNSLTLPGAQTITLTIGLIIAMSALPTEAHAQSFCGKRAEVVKNLSGRYSENPVSMGLANDGSVVEVFSSEAGTFTIISTRPSGQSCLVTSGDVWESLPVRKAGSKI